MFFKEITEQPKKKVFRKVMAPKTSCDFTTTFDTETIKWIIFYLKKDDIFKLKKNTSLLTLTADDCSHE